MTRGVFDFIAEQGLYINAEKKWVIELKSSTSFWYDLLQNSHDEFDTHAAIRKRMRSMETENENPSNAEVASFI